MPRSNNNMSRSNAMQSSISSADPQSRQGQTVVSSHQVHSLMLLYARLASLVCAPVVTPILLPLALGVVNVMTGGQALVVLLLTALLWRAGIAAIYHYCGSSTVALDKALAVNETRLPVLAAVTSAVLVHLVRWTLGGAAMLAWYPSVSQTVAFFGRVECTVVLLQASVFLRYFGPLSISKY